MNFDPVELERLAQVARRKHSSEHANTPYGVMPSGEFGQIARALTDIADKLRTGQLVPAQPSGDVVEAVARAIRRSEIGNFSDETRAQAVVDGSWEHRIQEATAAITAYEAVSGVANMREALVDDPNWIAAGIPDEAIEAGVAAWDAANEDMQSPSPKADWDEGMIVAAIFKAAARAALGEQP